MKRFLWYGIYISIVVGLIFVVTVEARKIDSGDVLVLSEAEKAYIESAPVITVAIDPEYAPFEFYEDEVPRGLTIDYLNLLSAHTGLTFEYVYYPTFKAILEAVYTGEVTMTGGAIRTEDRMPHMHFTDSFYTNYDVVLVRSDFGDISEEALEALPTGVIEDYSVNAYLLEAYPDIDLTTYPNITDGLKALSFGEIDAFVTDFSQAAYYIYKYGYHNIKALDGARISGDGDLRFGVRKGDEQLVLILNKALAALSEDEREAIHQNWIGIRVAPLISRHFVTGVAIAIAVLILIALGFLFVNRLLRREVALKTAQLQKELAHVKQIEVNLQNLNETLEEKVKSRTRELETVIQDLNETQEKVIQSEKMAFLGNLVAGVAHEINSPLGVLLTGSTHLKSETDKTVEAFETSTMTKGALTKYLGTVSSLTETIDENARRVSRLVQSFKQLAVDQNQTEKTVFSLKETCDAVIEQFRMTGHTGAQIENGVPKTLIIKSTPSAFTQILTQLIKNSIQHSGDGSRPVTIKVSCEDVVGGIILTVEDDGIGMSELQVTKIFDPFYTSKRHLGNTGLGMHIVFNLVKHQLGGDLDIENVFGSGFKVVMKIPL